MKNLIDNIVALASEGNADKVRDLCDTLVAKVKARPVEVEVLEEELTESHTPEGMGAVRISRGDNVAVYRTPYYAVVSRRGMSLDGHGGSLFSAFGWLCDYLFKKEKARPTTPDEDATAQIMLMQLDLLTELFGDPDYLVDVSSDVLHRKLDYYQRLEERAKKIVQDPANKEDAELNAAFAKSVETLGHIVGALERKEEKK